MPQTARTRYREQLRDVAHWDAFLRAESRLPGPRANLELAHAVAVEGDAVHFSRWAALDPREAPENTPDVFLVFCGALGLGRLLAEGRREWLPTLRQLAADSRWRVREGVATGLQTWGDADMDALIDAMGSWATGNAFEQRAVVAALCEPRLLGEDRHARRVLALLDDITTSLAQADDRRSDGHVALRKTLGYGWSVAVAALPAPGKAMFARWCDDDDPDVHWVVRENLGKARLKRLGPEWVEQLRSRVR
jgi:hypothetical protein